jgi:soluble lytic murein transglycosylase-like protein
MRQLAVAGSILLVCVLGCGSSASARNIYPIAIRTVAPSDEAPSTGWYAEAPAREQRYRSRRAFSWRRPARSSAAGYVLAAARRHGVPEALAYGVASVESGFNPRARSHAGAVGLMGIMPSTARGLGCRGSLTNPEANAECGARYLASILDDQAGDLRRAAALYNQGRFAHRISRGGARYAALVLARARHQPT